MASNALDGKPLGDGVAALTGAAASVGLRAVVEAGGSGVSRLLGRGVEDAEGEAATVAHDVEGDVSKGDVCGLSFAANTPVTLADGSVRAIAALKTGDTVLAYDPTTSKAGPQPVEHVFVNHDANLVDVMLVSDGAARTPATSAASDGKARDAAVAARGTRAPPAPVSTMTHTETIRTTTNHPWYTADHDWLPASFLRIGERVVRADGGSARVAAVRAVAGAAAMYDLTVGMVHTFVVGDGRYVVHNCGGDQPKVARVREAGPNNPQVDHAIDFDAARGRAFEEAGWTEDTADLWHPSKFDPETGTYVEFEGPGGAKVAYDNAHADMDPSLGHNQPHVGWQSAGKRGLGGARRGNITYDGPTHPFRSPNKGEGLI